jgi:hypothetical protein
MDQEPAAQSASLAKINVGFVVVCLATMGD